MKYIFVILVLIVASQVLVATGPSESSEFQGEMICEYVPSPIISSRILKPEKPPMILVCKYVPVNKNNYSHQDKEMKYKDKYKIEEKFGLELPSIGPVKDFFEAEERLERIR